MSEPLAFQRIDAAKLPMRSGGGDRIVKISSISALAAPRPWRFGPSTSHPTLLGTNALDVDSARYRRNVEILCGERAARLPNGEQVQFTDRFAPSPGHQLDLVLE